MGQIGQFLPFILMFVVMFVFILMPQQKKMKKEKEFEKNLKVGDKIITKSGIHGKIAELADDTVVIETMAGKLKLERTAISLDLSQKVNATVKKA